ELVEMLRTYPRCQYQALVVRHVITCYTTLRTHLADQMREVDFCRTRLGELLRAFEGPAEGGRPEKEGVPGRHLLPSSCGTLDEAVEQLLTRVPPADLEALDQKVQAVIRQQFTALVHVCMTASNLLKNLEGAMQHEAEPFIESRLLGTDVLTM